MPKSPKSVHTYVYIYIHTYNYTCIYNYIYNYQLDKSESALNTTFKKAPKKKETRQALEFKPSHAA